MITNVVKRNLSLLFIAGIVLSSVMTGCKKDDDIVVLEPITLDCNYFSTDRTLTDDPDRPVDYIITCVMNIGSADIVIEPGVVIHFEAGAGISLDGSGSLKAVGTATNKITFSSEDKVKGSWKGLFIDGVSVNNIFDYCVIEYAGSAGFGGDRLSAVTMWAGSKLTVKNTTISNSAGNGLDATAGGGGLTHQNNIYKDNTKAGLRVSPDNAYKADLASSYTGNGEDVVQIFQNTQEFPTGTLRKLNVPYRVLAMGAGNSVNGIRVDGDLTIEPGTTIEFGTSTGIYVKGTSSLKAVGTASQPITFTGITATAGSWGGIYFDASLSVLNEVSYATIEYAGSDAFLGSILMYNKPMLKVNNVTFKDISSCGMYARPSISAPNPNLTEADNTFTRVAGGNICAE